MRRARLASASLLSPTLVVTAFGHPPFLLMDEATVRVLLHWVILAHHADRPVTAGLPSAADAPLQRGELAKSQPRKPHNICARFVGAFNQAEARRREEPRHRLQLAPYRGD